MGTLHALRNSSDFSQSCESPAQPSPKPGSFGNGPRGVTLMNNFECFDTCAQPAKQLQHSVYLPCYLLVTYINSSTDYLLSIKSFVS